MRTTKGQSGKPDEMTEDQIRRLNLAKQGYSQVANISTDSALIRAAQEAGIYCQIDRKSIWGNPEPCHGNVLIRELAITDATGETAVAS